MTSIGYCCIVNKFFICTKCGITSLVPYFQDSTCVDGKPHKYYKFTVNELFGVKILESFGNTDADARATLFRMIFDQMEKKFNKDKKILNVVKKARRRMLSELLLKW